MKIRTNNPLSVKRIEILAKKTREKFNISEDVFFPILDIVEQLSNEGILNLEICEDDELGESVGLYIKDTNTIKIKESVYIDGLDGDYRTNFTLAHEYFHFLQNQVLKFDFIEVDDNEEIPAYCDPEWQANEFAGQLLIPTKYISLSHEEISKLFHVTKECALTRQLYLKKRENRK